MSTATIIAYDAIARNEHVLPTNVQAAGYDTQLGGGTGNIAWNADQFARHTSPYPAAHIDQDAGASDTTADWLDVEAGAASASEIVGWIRAARNNYIAQLRPAQRSPGIYCSQSNVTSLVALLQQAQLINVPFWVANYGVTAAQAQAAVANALGPYPAAAFQFNNTAFGGLADTSYYSVAWLATMTGAPDPAEAEMFITEMVSPDLFIPFPSGTFKTLMLYRDYIDNANPAPTIRVAIHSQTQGYGPVKVVALPSSAPVAVAIDFAVDVNGVSLAWVDNPGPVGVCLL